MSKSTKELSEELLAREGIQSILVKPYEEVKITVGQQETTFTGPAVILINRD